MPKRPIKVNKQTPLLDVKKLSLEIEEKSLLSNISLRLSDNEILALVGESGRGKSLFVLSLLGLQPKAQLTTDHLLFEGDYS